MSDPATGQPLIEPDCSAMITRRINEFINEQDSAIALIVQPPARRALASLLKQRASRCLVLSINELPATQAVEVVGVIGAAEGSEGSAQSEIAPTEEELIAA
ncbi:MAG: hypothetical protein AAGE86_05310 [Pseudomonadota bacterium]